MSTEKVSGMRELVIAVGGPLRPTENRKGWLCRVAAVAKISVRSAKAAFYREPTSARVREKLRAAAGKHEATNLAHRFESLAQALNVRDQNFHGEDIAALLNAARALRGLDRTGDSGE